MRTNRLEKLELNKTGKNVLLTGAAGFLGTAIVNRLVEKDFKVTALVRRSSDSKHLDHKSVSRVYGDVCDATFLATIMKDMDYVIHAAATFAGDWEHFHRVNVKSCEDLIQQALKFKINRFVYISSVSVYKHSTLSENFVFTEDMPFEDDQDTTFYSRSKIEAEKVVRAAVEKSKLPGVILRPGAIYGPKGHIFPATLGLGIGEDRIILMGDSSTKLPLSYVDNVADAIVQSLTLKSVVGECINWVEDETLSRGEYVKKVKEKANPNLSIINFPMWFMEGMKSFLKFGFGLIGRKAPLSTLNLKMYSTSIFYSNEKAKKLFREKAFVPFDESIERTMAWHKARLTPERSQGLEKGKVSIPSVRKLNVGIVGCGNIAHAHLMFLSRIESVGNIFVSDPQEASRNSVSEKFSIVKGYSDYKEMFNSENLDVVHVLTPPQFHSEVAAYAAQKGCHILVEKPMAVNGDEARRMNKVAEENQVKICVMHNHLYDKVMIRAREILSRKLLGRITFVESWYGTQFGTFEPPHPPEYWGYSLPGSLFQDFLPHALYIANDLMGGAEIHNVIAEYSGGVQGVEHDELKIFLKKGGLTGLVSVSMSVSPRYQFVNVYGTQGSMKIDLLNKIVLLDKQIGPVPKSINRVLTSFKHGAAYFGAGLRSALKLNKVEEGIFEGSDRQIQLFYRSILRDDREPVPGSEGLEIMLLMDQVWQEMHQGQSAQSTRLRA